eukprot:3865868-Pyramimonas_sp.AAC.1
MYSSNALSQALSLDGAPVAPAPLPWQVCAVPDDAMMRSILMMGFRGFLQSRVDVMKRRQLCYNARGIRLDGNFKL